MMTREEFEAALRRDGYEVGEGKLAAGFHNAEHAHDYGVKALVLEGEITLTCDGARQTYRPGDTFTMAAGLAHMEDVGDAGVRYVVGRLRRT
jgi:quercetin dioxygenase-like cupin family protein